eukprot:180801_1
MFLSLLFSVLLYISCSYSSENSRKILEYTSSYNSWVLSSQPLLPRQIFGSAIGHYNETIFILGGFYDKQQLITYDISLNEFNDSGITSLSHEIYGAGQFYTQNNNIIYMIDNSPYPSGIGNKFSIFNVETQQFTYNWNNITIPFPVKAHSCLSYSNNYLFILGGAGGSNGNTVLKQFQIFNVSANEWLSNVPDMSHVRSDAGCIVHENVNELYVAGGYYESIDSISVSNLSDISNANWYYIGDVLVPPNGTYNTVSNQRLIITGNDIVIIGGYHSEGFDSTLITVTVIDTTTNIIRSGGNLNYAVRATSAILVNDIIYAFGGGAGQFYPNWQYKHLTPTNEPTTSPTYNPTSIPSYIPTHYPTSNPTTSNPTITPTYNPSNIPSETPTNYPTSVPTYNPTDITDYPTNNPTYNPTMTYNPTSNPTQIPTYNPIYVPTNNPTNIPTYNPSGYPTVNPTYIPTNNPTQSPSISDTET